MWSKMTRHWQKIVQNDNSEVFWKSSVNYFASSKPGDRHFAGLTGYEPGISANKAGKRIGRNPSSEGDLSHELWEEWVICVPAPDPKRCALKALPTFDHAQPRHEALEADHVPFIDLAQLSVGSSHDAARTKAALAEACHDWGFFQVRKQCQSYRKKLLSFLTLILSLIKFWRRFCLQVVNHGVSQELVQSFRAQCLDLFSFPME